MYRVQLSFALCSIDDAVQPEMTAKDSWRGGIQICMFCYLALSTKTHATCQISTRALHLVYFYTSDYVSKLPKNSDHDQVFLF